MNVAVVDENGRPKVQTRLMTEGLAPRIVREVMQRTLEALTDVPVIGSEETRAVVGLSSSSS